jgi:DtxR family Mn-dependent transcriptional regulator
MEDYLKGIYHCQEESDCRVQTSTLADHMAVESATVTSMLGKLSDRGLVQYEPYQGVELSDTGLQVATEVIRHHRILEQFLTEQLGYDWSEVHEEADQLEHHVSDQFVQQVVQQLEGVEVDPHGDPIPTEELEIASSETSETLAGRQEGDRIRIDRVRDQNRDVLEYLANKNVRPGKTAEIVEVAPFGMVTLSLDEHDGIVTVPQEIATSVCGELLSDASQ